MSISHPSSTSRTLTPPSTSTYALPKQSTPASSSTLHDIDLEKKTSTEMNGDDDSDEISPYSEKTTSLTADEMRSRAQSQAQAKAIAGGRERDPSPSSSTLQVTTDSQEQSPTTTTTPKHGEKSWQTSDKDLVKQPENNLLLVMPSLMLCLFLAALDQTIVATALPTISSELNATSAQYSWVGTSYLLASTALTPLFGRLTDIVGRKPVLYPGIALFVIGSALCGASQSMNMLIGSRAIQGIGGSSIMSLTNFIVGDVVPLEKRGLYNGFLGAVWGIASAVGPIAGGLLTQRVTWRWCFFINLPTAGLAFACLFFFLKLNTVQKLTWSQLLKSFDFPGLFLLMIGCALLVVGFAFASDSGWSDTATIALLVVGFVLIILAGINFLYTSKWTGRTPLIPPRMLKTRTTVFFLIASTLQALAFLSASYYLPVFFQGVDGTDPLMSGVYLIPFSFMVAIATIISGQINARFKIIRPVAWFGYGLACLCFGLLIKYLAYGTSTAAQLVILAFAGLGVGLSLAVPLLVIQAAMPLKDMASSTSAWILTRSMGGTMGIAIFQAVLSSQLENRFTKIPGFGTDFGIPKNIEGYNQIHNLPAGPQRDAVLTAFSESLRTLYMCWCPIFGCALLISLFTKSYSLSRTPAGQPVLEKDEGKVDVEKGPVDADADVTSEETAREEEGITTRQEKS